MNTEKPLVNVLMRWSRSEGKEFTPGFFEINYNGSWLPYTHSLIPQVWRKPDYDIPGGSRGYATMQNMLRLGARLVENEKQINKY